MPLKVITVDFWNTIVDSSNGIGRNSYRQRVLVEEMQNLDYDLTHELWGEATKASWQYFNSIWTNEHRTPSADETIEYFWKYLELPYSKSSVNICKEAFAGAILKHPPKLLSGVVEAFDKWKDNYDLAIVSDTGFSPGSTLRELMSRLGVLDYFKSFSFSDESGVSKPHPKAFRYVLDELDAHPSEALHVGDIERTDIVGAKRIGMKAIRYMGDPSGEMNKQNPKATLADREAQSWEEVIKQVDELSK